MMSKKKSRSRCRANWAVRNDDETARLLSADDRAEDIHVTYGITDISGISSDEILQNTTGRIIEPMIKWL